MIAVCIVTYNQEAFIAQAIESARMQKCDEPIRIYIGDDASNDKTGQICRQYAEKDARIVYYRRDKNIGLVNNTIDLYHRIMADKCKYIAMLDGDDYWIAPNKLQMQIQYLREHDGFNFVHTAAYDDINGNLTIETPYQSIPVGNVSHSYGRGGLGQTNSTVVFSTNLLKDKDLDNIAAQHFRVLDYPLYGIFSQYTYMGYIDTPTTAWRIHTSVSNPKSIISYGEYQFHYLRCWRWLEKRYPGKFGYSCFRAFGIWIYQILYLLWRSLKTNFQQK